MPNKKRNIEDWITTKEAASLLTARSGHLVSEAYVRRLAMAGKIEVWEVDARTKLYLKSDVEGYTVKQRGTGEVRRRIRNRRPEPDAA
jgi:hypothetical protein